jgi:hypothetical protein
VSPDSKTLGANRIAEYQCSSYSKKWAFVILEFSKPVAASLYFYDSREEAEEAVRLWHQENPFPFRPERRKKWRRK